MAVRCASGSVVGGAAQRAQRPQGPLAGAVILVSDEQPR